MKTRSFLSKITVFFVILLSCPIITFAQGVTFIDIPNPAQTTNVDLYDVWGSDANNVFAVGRDGMFLKYNGSSAVQITNPSASSLWSVSGSSATDVWAVGLNGTAVHYNGSNLTVYNVGTPNQLLCVKAFAADNVWACGVSGTIAHWGGSSWSMVSNAYSNSDFAQVSGTSASMYFVGGDNFAPYAIKIYSYDGTAFTEILNDLDGNYWSRIFTQDDNFFYLFGPLDTYSYNKTSGVVTKIYESGSSGAYAFSATDLLIVGGDSGIVYFNGTDWKVLHYSNNTEAVYAPQNDKASVFFVGDGGLFFRCDLTVGIKEEPLAPSKFSVYPNPASDQIIIDLSFDQKINTKIELFNLVGQQVKQSFELVGNDFRTIVNIGDLPSGSYFVKVTTDGSSFSKKLIIVK